MILLFRSVSAPMSPGMFIGLPDFVADPVATYDVFFFFAPPQRPADLPLKGFVTIPLLVSDDAESAHSRFAQMHLSNPLLRRFAWKPATVGPMEFMDVERDGDEIVFSSVGPYGVVDEVHFAEAFGPQAILDLERMSFDAQVLCSELAARGAVPSVS